VVNGAPTSDFPAVGILLAIAQDGSGYAFCSGTFIASTWALTAAHCIEEALYFQDADYDIAFAIGDDVTTQSGIDDLAWSAALYIHADYQPESLVDDVGLIELHSALGVSPMALSAQRPSLDWLGDELTFVGWGITGDDEVDAGVKRTVDIPIYELDSAFVYVWDTDDGRNLCLGDSGGPAMIEEDGEYTLVGVNSFVFGEDEATLCEEGGAGIARLDRAGDWINAVLDGDVAPDTEFEAPESSGTGGNTLPADEKGGCSAGAAAAAPGLAWLALLALGAGRRRR